MYRLSEVVRKYSFCKHRKKGHDHRSLLLLSVGDIDFTVDPAPLELKKTPTNGTEFQYRGS